MQKNTAGCFGSTNRLVLISIATISLVVSLFCHHRALAANSEIVVTQNDGWLTYDAVTGTQTSFTGFGQDGEAAAFLSRNEIYGSGGGFSGGIVYRLTGGGTQWARDPDIDYPAGNAAFQAPKGIAIGPDNGIYVAFSYGHNIWRFSPGMRKSQSIYVTNTPAHLFPQALAFHPITKRLYVGYGGGSGRGVWRIDSVNNGVQIVPTGGQVNGLAIDTNGLIYISVGSNVRRYTQTGTPFGRNGDTNNAILITAGEGGLIGPAGLAFGPDGNLYVANNDGNNAAGGVWRYRPDGTPFGINGNNTNGLFILTGECYWVGFSPFRVPLTISTNTTVQIATVDLIQRSEIVYRAVSNACVIMQTDPVTSTNYLAGLGISADVGSCVKLTLTPGTILRVAQVDAGQNTQIIIPSAAAIEGNVALGTPLIGNDGGTLIGNDVGTLIANDGGTLQANIDSAIAKPTGEALIGNDGGSIVGSGGLNLVAGGGLNLVPGGPSKFSDRAFKASAADQDGKGTKGPRPPGGSTVTGSISINGDYSQDRNSVLSIAITGTNFTDSGAQEYDRLVVAGHAELSGGIGFGLFAPDDSANNLYGYAPPLGSTFDVVVAKRITVTNLIVRGPMWGDGRHFAWSVVDTTNNMKALRLVTTNFPPFLVLERFGSGVQMAFPTNYQGFRIESAPVLGTTNWVTESTGTNRLVLPLAAANRFFRLAKP